MLGAFLEKTGEAVPGEVNAGIYVLERSVLDLIPAGREVSIERDVFPRLVGEGLGGLRLDGYWMDIGTPDRYLQASWDILEGRVETQVEPTAPRPAYRRRCRGSSGARPWARAPFSGRPAGSRRGAKVRDSVAARGLHGGRGGRGERLDPRPRGRGRARRELDAAVIGADEKVPAT